MSAESGSGGFVFDYKHVFICGGFYNSIADLGFFIGILIDVLIITTYSRCRLRNPGASDFGFQMLVLEFIDAIPEAMFIGESIVDGSIALPVVLAILTLNIVNTMCTGFDLLGPDDGGGGSAGSDAEVELVLRDYGVRPPVIFGAAQPHRSSDARPLLLENGSGGGGGSDEEHAPRKKSVTHLALFCLINFSMGNILLAMLDEIYVEFEKSFENTPAGWLQNVSLILGTILGTATVMLIIAGNAGMRKSGGGCCKRGGGDSQPTFSSRLVLLVTSFFFVSLFAMAISGCCGLICKVLAEKNVAVIHPLFEGFSGGAFIGAVAGIMVPESSTQLRHSGFAGVTWTQMFGMVMFVSGITCGMLAREILFSTNPVLWEYCHVVEEPHH